MQAIATATTINKGGSHDMINPDKAATLYGIKKRRTFTSDEERKAARAETFRKSSKKYYEKKKKERELYAKGEIWGI